jgi:hypothetical protein
MKPILLLITGLVLIGCSGRDVTEPADRSPYVVNDGEAVRPMTPEEILRDGLRPADWMENRVFVYFDPAEKYKEYRVEIDQSDNKVVWVYNPDVSSQVRAADANETKYALWRLANDVIPVHRDRAIFRFNDPDDREKTWYVHVFKGRYEITVRRDGKEDYVLANRTERLRVLQHMQDHLVIKGDGEKAEYYRSLLAAEIAENERAQTKVARDMEQTIQDYRDMARDLQHEINAMIATGVTEDLEAKKNQLTAVKLKVEEHTLLLDKYLADDWRLRTEDKTEHAQTRTYNLVQFNPYVNDLHVISGWVMESVAPNSWGQHGRTVRVNGDVLVVRNTVEVIEQVREYLDQLEAAYQAEATQQK